MGVEEGDGATLREAVDGDAVGGGVGIEAECGEGIGVVDGDLWEEAGVGFVVLGSHRESGAREVDGGGDVEGGDTAGIGIGGGDELVVVLIDEGDIGIGDGGDGEVGGGAVDDGVEVGGASQPRHERGVAHELVDFPVVFLHFAGGGGGVDGEVAEIDNSAGGGDDGGEGLVVGVEEAVVDAQFAGDIVGGHCMADIGAEADRPIEVLFPVGGVGAADIGYRAGVFSFTEEGFGEAGRLVELAGEAAVANHEGGFVVVCHCIDMADSERRLMPFVPVAVGGVVYPADAGTVEVAECRCGGIGAAVAGDGDTGGGIGGVVLVVGDLVIAVVGIDVVVGDIVHIGVGIDPSIVAVVVCGVVFASDEGSVGEVGVVGKGVLLIEEGLVDDGGEGGGIGGGEATLVAVGEVVGGGPSGEVEVGDMVVGGVAGPIAGIGEFGVESVKLVVVAHEKEEGGGGRVVRGAVVEHGEVGGEVGIGGDAHVLIVEDVDEESL